VLVKRRIVSKRNKGRYDATKRKENSVKEEARVLIEVGHTSCGADKSHMNDYRSQLFEVTNRRDDNDAERNVQTAVASHV